VHQPRFIEWDDRNEAEHVARRPIPFAVGADVFADPARIERDAKPDQYGAPRFKTVGRVDGIAYAVIFAMRGDTAHIVSARRANRRERA
jgi:uncharacterized DUF497 family protein